MDNPLGLKVPYKKNTNAGFANVDQVKEMFDRMENSQQSGLNPHTNNSSTHGSRKSQGNYTAQSPRTDTSSYYGQSYQKEPLNPNAEVHNEGSARLSAHHQLQNRREQFSNAYANQFRSRSGAIDAWGNVKQGRE